MDYSLPGSSAYGISQARILEGVAISFFGWSPWPRNRTHVSWIGRGILYHWATWEAHIYEYFVICKVFSHIVFSESESHSVVSDSLWPHGILQARILECVAFPFSRGSFQTQGSNPGLQHCRQICYQLSHKGSSRMLKWVADPFSRASFWSRNRTGVSCIAGRFFTNWAIMLDSHNHNIIILYTYMLFSISLSLS